MWPNDWGTFPSPSWEFYFYLFREVTSPSPANLKKFPLPLKAKSSVIKWWTYRSIKSQPLAFFFSFLFCWFNTDNDKLSTTIFSRRENTALINSNNQVSSHELICAGGYTLSYINNSCKCYPDFCLIFKWKRTLDISHSCLVFWCFSLSKQIERNSRGVEDNSWNLPIGAPLNMCPIEKGEKNVWILTPSATGVRGDRTNFLPCSCIEI